MCFSKPKAPPPAPPPPAPVAPPIIGDDEDELMRKGKAKKLGKAALQIPLDKGALGTPSTAAPPTAPVV